jgi:hypothetical protein
MLAMDVATRQEESRAQESKYMGATAARDTESKRSSQNQVISSIGCLF